MSQSCRSGAGGDDPSSDGDTLLSALDCLWSLSFLTIVRSFELCETQSVDDEPVGSDVPPYLPSTTESAGDVGRWYLEPLKVMRQQPSRIAAGITTIRWR
ncbi:MAG: hypothetical protein ACRDWA_04205 [Acidimicrobiia bacterium]